MTATISAILAPTDLTSRGQEAIEYAAALAHLWDAPLVLIHTQRPATRPAQRARLAGARRRLEQLAGRYRNRGLRAEAFVREAPTAASGIVEMADEIGADLIVMATRRREPVTTRLFPGTTAAVTQHARCPVLSATPGGFVRMPVPASLEKLSEPLQGHRLWMKCPHTGENARCVAVQHEPSRNWVGLVQCNLLEGPDAPQTCDAACLRALTATGRPRPPRIVSLARVRAAYGDRRCWQCGSRKDISSDPHIPGVFFCRPCWDRVDGEAQPMEDIAAGD